MQAYFLAEASGYFAEYPGLWLSTNGDEYTPANGRWGNVVACITSLGVCRSVLGTVETAAR
jgi:hypothetical protein